jgi:D-serine deaminase-like pyridoxal phosphate-dependent protein
LYELSEEHGHLDVSRVANVPEVGDLVTVIPNHACGCTNQQNFVAVHRSGEPAGIWNVAARGQVR